MEQTSVFMNFISSPVFIELLVPVVIAGVGAIWTVTQYQIQKAYNKSSTHLAFQQQFKAFQSTLPKDINSRDENGNFNYQPPEGQKLDFNRKIEAYWWLVFDEWFVCCSQCKSCKSLWKDYYSQGVLNALEMPFFKDALFRLTKHKNSFLGQDESFKNEINRLYMKKHNGKELFKRD